MAYVSDCSKFICRLNAQVKEEKAVFEVQLMNVFAKLCFDICRTAATSSRFKQAVVTAAAGSTGATALAID
jgi:hypothetical protein